MQTKKLQMCELPQHKCKQENVLPFFASAIVLAFLLAFTLQTKAQMQAEKIIMLESRRQKSTYMSHCACICIRCENISWACAYVSVLCVNQS